MMHKMKHLQFSCVRKLWLRPPVCHGLPLGSRGMRVLNEPQLSAQPWRHSTGRPWSGPQTWPLISPHGTGTKSSETRHNNTAQDRKGQPSVSCSNVSHWNNKSFLRSWNSSVFSSWTQLKATACTCIHIYSCQLTCQRNLPTFLRH